MSAQPLTVDSVPSPRFEIRIRNVRGTLYIGREDSAIELSDTGAYLWRQLDGVRSVGAIAELVAGHYDIDLDTAVADVLELVGCLAGADIVTVAGPRGVRP
jgi:hypothetical protein